MNSMPVMIANDLTESLSDEECMEALRDGDNQAFDRLFERHAQNVLRYLRRMVGQESLAADLCQVTFLSLIQGRDRYVTGRAFRPWLYTIASNAARDAFRRGRKESLTEAGELPEVRAEPIFAQDHALDRQVRQALSQLPEGQREAIVLHRFEEMEFSEVGDILGITETAAKVRAHRGYERLRELLRDIWEQL